MSNKKNNTAVNTEIVDFFGQAEQNAKAKAGYSILSELCKRLDNETFKSELSLQELTEQISFLNFRNFFTYADKKKIVETFTSREDINQFMSDNIDNVAPKSSKMNMNEAAATWLKRCDAYIKSHIINVEPTTQATLNHSEEYSYTCKVVKGVYTFTEK